jgi:organic radical activating enzyme
MQVIPSTFCPAKWTDLIVNMNYNYVYACCKSTPLKFISNVNEVMDQQKINLLNGVQDSSCEFCWKKENANLPSLRQEYLENFDPSTLPLYTNNTIVPGLIEVNLGNACNFQCIYCNPKFSSQWEQDVREKPFKVFSDKYFYAIDEKNRDTIDTTIEWLLKIGPIHTLSLLGGEPLLNKHFFNIVEIVKSKKLMVTTNLSCKHATLDRLFALASQYEKIVLSISVDSTGKNAEFARYGMDFNTLLTNIHYVLAHAPKNVSIVFQSLMTSFTIRDLSEMQQFISTLHNIDDTIEWHLNVCEYPRILELNTLHDEYKPAILKILTELKTLPYIRSVDILEGAVIAAQFNNTLYQGMKLFLQEFSERKNIKIPICLK